MAFRPGFPNVDNVRDAPRAVGNAINAVRQRLASIDAELVRLASVADASGVVQTVQALQRTVRDLQARVSSLEAALGTQDVVTLAASVAVAAFDPVVASGASSCAPVDPNDPTMIGGPIGIARTAAGVGESVEIQRRGVIEITGATFEQGRIVYAGMDGLTQSPGYSAFAVPMGIAVTSSAMWVAPGWPALLVESLYADPFEDPVPVTKQLLANKFASLDALRGQADGIVVKIGDVFVTRTLLAGSGAGVTVQDGDGVAGDPTILPG